MKFLRTLFLLLLCVALPVSGLAASGLTGACPMQMSMGAGESGAMSSDMAGCENMKSAPAGKAKGFSCKVTAQCQVGRQVMTFR